MAPYSAWRALLVYILGIILVIGAIGEAFFQSAFSVAFSIVIVCIVIWTVSVPLSRSRRRTGRTAFAGERERAAQDLLRVLLLSRHAMPHVGGTETFVREFLSLPPRFPGLTIDAVLLEPPEGRCQPMRGVSFHYVTDQKLFAALFEHRMNERFWRSLILFIRTVWLLRNAAIDAASASRPDVIYAVGGPIALLSGVLTAFYLRVPLAVHFHWLYRYSRASFPSKLLISFLYGRADALIGNSPSFVDETMALDVPAKKCFWMFNWVDTAYFHPMNTRAQTRADLEIPDSKPLFLYVGRLDEVKQADRVLAALNREMPDATFVFAGDGPQMPLFQAAAALDQRIRPVGNQDRNALRNLYNAADVLLWGSIDIDYPSLVIMEAMCCGLPVIAANKSLNLFYEDEEVDASAFGAPQYVQLCDPTPEGIQLGIQTAMKNLENLKAQRSEIAAYAAEQFGAANAQRLIDILRAAARAGT